MISYIIEALILSIQNKNPFSLKLVLKFFIVSLIKLRTKLTKKIQELHDTHRLYSTHLRFEVRILELKIGKLEHKGVSPNN